jgi:hypothetical protein
MTAVAPPGVNWVNTAADERMVVEREAVTDREQRQVGSNRALRPPYTTGKPYQGGELSQYLDGVPPAGPVKVMYPKAPPADTDITPYAYDTLPVEIAPADQAAIDKLPRELRPPAREKSRRILTSGSAITHPIHCIAVFGKIGVAALRI